MPSCGSHLRSYCSHDLQRRRVTLNHPTSNTSTDLPIRFQLPDSLVCSWWQKASFAFASVMEGAPRSSLDESYVTIHEKTDIRRRLEAIFTDVRSLPLPTNDAFLGAGEPLISVHQGRWNLCKLHHEPKRGSVQRHPSQRSSRQRSVGRPCQVLPPRGSPHRHDTWRSTSTAYPSRRQSGLKITGIVDWDTGDGYPEYWEYTKALAIPLIGYRDD